ncbi:MAG: 50S ribosomal protein L33 [Patescibacteria group bacterium]
MAKKSRRTIINLTCTVCKSQNYVTEKNTDNMTIKNKGQNVKIALKKYCKRCRKVQEHKEAKV